MDLRYLTRSIHPSFKGSVGMGVVRGGSVLPLLIFCGDSQGFREVNEKAASVIFSYKYDLNKRPFGALILAPLQHNRPYSILTYFIYDNQTTALFPVSLPIVTPMTRHPKI